MEYYKDIIFTTIGRVESRFYHVDFKSEFYGIAFTRRGRIRFKKNNGQEKIINAPFVYWYSPENSYTHGCISGESRDHSWCFCTGKRIQNITFTVLDRLIPSGYQQITNPVEMCRLYDYMIAIYEMKDPSKHFQLAIAFEAVVGQVIESYFSFENKCEPELHQKIRSIASEIKLKPFGNWSFQAIAQEQLYVSYSYFRQVFRKIMNISPSEYLLNCRMEIAADMLTKNKYQIQEIAFQCGYDNAASFSRSFKKRIGISPSDYISHLQK